MNKTEKKTVKEYLSKVTSALTGCSWSLKKVFAAEEEIVKIIWNLNKKGDTIDHSVGFIINYKVGDLIVLDKLLEEALDISVNGKLIASGESMILDNKLAIRLSNVKIDE